jgi:hypothetical protein
VPGSLIRVLYAFDIPNNTAGQQYILQKKKKTPKKQIGKVRLRQSKQQIY